MKKSFRSLVLACLGVSVVLGSINTSEAGVIPWAYDAIFGPVGSLRNSSGSFLAYRPFRARRMTRRYGNMGYYPGTMCQPACNTGCNTSQYQAGYYPAYSSNYGQAIYYGQASYYGQAGCNNCSQGCASGNCSSGTTPAMGTTSAPTPAASNPAPTPTTTYKSTTPEIKPEATKSSETKGKSNSNYDEKNPAPDVFTLPKEPEVKEETKPEAKTNAPMFNDNGFGLPPVSKKIEAKKIPTTPLLPVEQRPKKPAPTKIEENSGIKLPSLPLVPAPIEIDDSKVTFMQAPQRTRIARTAHFHVPQVVRYVPSMNDSLIPPLPTPVHLAGK
jgi:hypothetical protein